MTVITANALCRVLEISRAEWQAIRRVCAPHMHGIERPRIKRGRTTYYWPVPDVVALFERIRAEPLLSDTIRQLYEQAEPL